MASRARARGAVRELSRLQPYQPGQLADPPPLLTLHRLWNWDKHRTTQLAHVFPTVASWSSTGPGDIQPMVPWGQALRDGDEVMRIPDVPDAILDDTPTVELAIVLGEGPLTGTPVVPLLTELHRYVSVEVLAAFAGVLEPHA